ncbi:MAG: endopeptidase La [Pseudomonadota bacterium]
MNEDAARGELLDAADPDEANAKPLALPDDALPEELVILPVYGRPFFPAQVHAITIDREQWEPSLKAALEHPMRVAGLMYCGESPSDDGTVTFHDTGTVVRIHHVASDDDHLQFIAQGIRRFTVNQWLNDSAPWRATAHYPVTKSADSNEVKAYAMSLIQAIKELVNINPLYNEEVKNFLTHFNLNQPSPLADFGAAITTADGDELQRVLDTVRLLPRMKHVTVLLRKEIEVAQLHQRIESEVNQRMSSQQREFFLREQLKVIQTELGLSKDDRTSDIDDFTARMDAVTPPEHVKKRFDEEIKKLSLLETGSPEYGVTRNYLDWVTSVPWGVHSEDNLAISHARGVLDDSHAGLADVKDRIVEFLAVGAYRGEVSGSILLLVGPPGVGKTSIGRAVADALGRKFYRFSLGGMRDEAEIKGHRRTYIGAMPGKLVQALKDVEVSNPVIMLDEIDKIGSSFQGDPASALLEVLDPEQNNAFLDHYLDLRVDLSKVLFICTANQLDTIPRPLLDRMDRISLSGYIAQEKFDIAKAHLMPRVLTRAGLKKRELKISDATLRQIIEGYAREAGVRNLEKLLQRIARKAVVEILEQGAKRVSVTGKNLQSYLGAPLFRPEEVLKGVGVVTGLAWTALGGATLPVEASRVHGAARGLKLTGQLGDVMRESAEIACSYVTANVAHFGADPTWFDTAALHVHVPEGATPKDGPSAGVTLTTALISLATGRRIKRKLAMTGELTLTGQVLAVGGIREKVIAARRSRIFEVILPAANRSEFDELPEQIKTGVTAHFAQTYQDVFDVVFS